MRSNKTTFGCFTTDSGLVLEAGQVCNYNGVLPAGKPGDLVTIKEIAGFCDRDPSKLYVLGTYGEMQHEIKIRLVDNQHKLTIVHNTPNVLKGRKYFDARMVVDPNKTLRIGQVWDHYKGGRYIILGISLDSNNPEDFNKAIIQYCNTSDAGAIVWSLPLNEWFRTVQVTRNGNPYDEPRFTQVPSVDIELSPYFKTLYELWQCLHKHVN